RVVPMLPERLSADLCSLIEGENRPVLAVHLTITSEGRVKAHRFERAMMRSAASLSYEQAQAAIDGVGGQVSEALLDTVLRPLWACYGAMAQARDARHPLDLDVPEFRTKLGPDGRISGISRRVRLDAHRLIE
ncbi:MAG TPA: ribonuclease R, partial [Alphaproteobacteria bacterium]|nr:ribonuclease R [Alphaproteobacteria bacterium]